MTHQGTVRRSAKEWRLTYYFPDRPSSMVPRVAHHTTRSRPAKAQRNPIALAREWQCALADDPTMSRADLARQRGVSRARVTQVLRLLDLIPQVVEAVAALGDPLSTPMITERQLRPLLNRPADEQWQAIAAITTKSEAKLREAR